PATKRSGWKENLQLGCVAGLTSTSNRRGLSRIIAWCDNPTCKTFQSQQLGPRYKTPLSISLS
ncbi:MAG TPA: hypothetical protein VF627_00065, partial [Abditibacterium sp.]